MGKKRKILITLGILLLILIVFYVISYIITKYTGYSITGGVIYSKETKVKVGKCLADKKTILYCNSISLNCLRQKRILGEIFKYVSYVDCSENFEVKECEKLPAWKINDKFYYGVYDLKRLAEFTGCEVG